MELAFFGLGRVSCVRSAQRLSDSAAGLDRVTVHRRVFRVRGRESFQATVRARCHLCLQSGGQVYDFADFTPHVSVLQPRQVGNHKLAVQQGCFTVTNVLDIEQHIRFNESEGRKFLTKYELDVRERPKVIRELSLMGISAVQLMPSVEAVCKKALEDLVGLVPMEPPK